MKSSITLGVILAALLFSAIAFAAPGIPNRFHGTVNFLNGPAPDGLAVDAKINGLTVATATTYKGTYGYAPNVFDITEPEPIGDSRDGKTISFFVNGIVTNTSTFKNGESTELNLQINGYVNELPPTNEPIVNQIIAINQTSPAKITVGDSLSITISSQTSGIATIQNITKLSGAYAIPSGKNELNAFEIKISGNVTITITMKYSDAGIDESTILPYKFDGTRWVALPIIARDTASNTITFAISSAQTPYAIMGSPVQNVPATTSSNGGENSGVQNSNTPTPAVCTPDWSCSSWSSCINGVQTRSCTDTNNCGKTENRPALSQSCTVPAINEAENEPTTTNITSKESNPPSMPTGFFLTSTASAGVAALIVFFAGGLYLRKKGVI